MATPLKLSDVLAAIGEGRREPVYLVSGDRVLAEPAALEIGKELAGGDDRAIEIHRRPARPGLLLADLKTYSLFGPGKIIVAVETALVADRKAAADLVDEAAEVVPLAREGDELSGRDRRAGCLLLQVLRLFGIDSASESAEGSLSRLPDWALQGGTAYRRGRRRGRGRRQVEELRTQLCGLLEASWASGLESVAADDLAELSEVVRRGLPEGHSLVMAESTVAGQHPLVEALASRRALVEVGRVEAARRGGWSGLEHLAEGLQKETGTAIRPDALSELARRTLQSEQRRSRAGGSANADSTERFAAEYRKLASISGQEVIDLDLVEDTIADRGQEDVWKILDAVGSGRAEEALHRLGRLLAGSEDPIAARLSFFALLAGFARQLAAIGGMRTETEGPEQNYQRFKSRVAPKLQQDLAGGRPNPLAGLHPYRLHRAYLTALRVDRRKLETLPARILEAELRMKGESAQPETVLAELVTELALAAR